MNKLIFQFSNEDIHTAPDPCKEYWINSRLQNSGFNEHLLLVRKHPELIPSIKLLVQNKKILNHLNTQG